MKLGLLLVKLAALAAFMLSLSGCIGGT